MTLKINGATGGSVSIDAPDNTSPAGTDVTLTLPTSAGAANQVLKNSGTAGTLEYGVALPSGNGTSGQYLQTAGDGTTSWQTVEGLPDAIDVNASAPADSVNIDSSGRLLVGLTTGNNRNLLQIQGDADNGANGVGGISLRRGVALGSIGNGSQLGQLDFCMSDGGVAARILCDAEGSAGTGDYPGRLEFYTTADGAASPTERMRITQQGDVVIGRATAGDGRLTSYGRTTDGTDNTLYLANSNFTKLFRVRNDGLFDTGTTTSSPYNFTTSQAANMYVSSSGLLYRSTSSARFKTDIETLEDSYADAILNVNPVWYRSTAPGDAIHPNWGYYGFIAEDVGRIDPRLVFWKTHEVTQDEEGNETTVELDEPIADGVQYDRFVPHLLNLVKRQKEQLETQAASIAALEARLTALEGGAA